MAELNGFNAHEVEPDFSFEAIPAGRYLAAISASEMKPNRSGTGSYLQLTFRVEEGDYKGRLLWTMLNLDHPNATAVRLARAELSAICRAVGVMSPGDSMELHDLPLTLTVGVRKRDDTGELTNTIRAYDRRESAAPTPPSNNGTPPWKRVESQEPAGVERG